MKICFYADSYPTLRPFGGIAVFTQIAARALARRGHECHVLVGKPGQYDDHGDGDVEVHLRPARWLPLLGDVLPSIGESWDIARELKLLHDEHHFDIVEFPNWEGIGVISSFRKSLPFVVRLHTSMAESVAVQDRRPRWGERVMIWAERVSARRARGVVTHSAAHRDALMKTYGLTDVHLIPHGIPIPPPRDAEPAAPMVLSIGRLNARKGGPTLIAAIPRVLADAPRARFVVVGAGEDHPLVKQFRAEHPTLGERVRFLDFASAEELAALHASATVYASASVYESFGLTFVEAMARSVPVVGCAVSAMPEVISHEETGLLVPPNDAPAFASAILRLLDDDALRLRLGTAARHAAETRFSDERMATDIESWYQSILRR